MPTISARIKKYNAGRIPEYTALKYSMMAENPFRFFRGTCHLFYEDLRIAKLPTSPLVWSCGDLHIENFGTYKGDNRLVYFDLNDFDEALLAPAAWEIVRMVTSILVAFDTPEVKQKEALQLAGCFLKKYSETLARGKQRYIEYGTAKGIIKTFIRQVEERKQKELVYRHTVKTAKGLRFFADNQHFYRIGKQEKKALIKDLGKWLKHNRKGYLKNCDVLDVCFRVSGTGSIGLKRYIFLLENKNIPNKYLLIDMKQAGPSSVKSHLKNAQPAWDNEADRIVAIQERMQNVAPALLSTINFQDNAYVLKELQPVEDKINFDLIKDQYKEMSLVIEDMGMLAASAQLRSSGRQGSAITDQLMAFGTIDWHQSILDLAIDYAKRVKKDYAVFVKDYKKGMFL